MVPKFYFTYRQPKATITSVTRRANAPSSQTTSRQRSTLTRTTDPSGKSHTSAVTDSGATIENGIALKSFALSSDDDMSALDQQERLIAQLQLQNSQLKTENSELQQRLKARNAANYKPSAARRRVNGSRSASSPRSDSSDVEEEVEGEEKVPGTVVSQQYAPPI